MRASESGAPVPQPVAAARVLVYLGAGLCVLGALASAAVATVAASFTGVVRGSGSAAGTGGLSGVGDIGDLASLFGTVVAVWFAFWAVALGLGAWLWFWIGSALRHGHRGARMTATVLSGLVLLVAGPPVLTGAVDGASAATLTTALVVLAVPPAVIVLLWVPDQARRHFGDPVHDGPSTTWPPDPTTGPVGTHAPWSPAGGPFTARCAACGADAAPSDTRCAGCGLPLAAAARRPELD